MEDLRSNLDKLDTQILALLADRMVLSRKLGEYKRSKKIPIQDKAREAALRARIRQLADIYDLNPEFCTEVYELILIESKRLQSKDAF